MKLTSTVTRSGAVVEAGRGERADVGLFQRHNLGPCAQRFVQLPAADIDRVDGAAPRSSSTCVKPPVEAPTSRQTRPRGSKPK